jgi:hypothetical protein
MSRRAESSRLGVILFLDRTFASTPNFEETPTVAIEQGRVAEAAIDGANEAIDSMTNTAVVLVGDWFPGGGMAAEQ